jgi:hypothetical protein
MVSRCYVAPHVRTAARACFAPRYYYISSTQTRFSVLDAKAHPESKTPAGASASDATGAMRPGRRVATSTSRTSRRTAAATRTFRSCEACRSHGGACGVLTDRAAHLDFLLRERPAAPTGTYSTTPQHLYATGNKFRGTFVRAASTVRTFALRAVAASGRAAALVIYLPNAPVSNM